MADATIASVQRISAELRPSVLEDLVHVSKVINDCREIGVMFALDDFGTGYSSLSYLKKFDIDYLKIDQVFVRNLENDHNDMALCEAIVIMAHKLGLKVIAEGVETAQQRDMLTVIGCDYAQGFLFSRPLPADEIEKVLLILNDDALVH